MKGREHYENRNTLFTRKQGCFKRRILTYVVKRGVCITKEQFDLETENEVTIGARCGLDKDVPIFNLDRSYIQKFV